MTRFAQMTLVVAALILAGCGGGSTSSRGSAIVLDRVTPQTSAAIRVTSPAFAGGGQIPGEQAGREGNRSPPLAWTSVPHAAAYAVVVQDTDAPGARPFVHWLVWNIPPIRTALAEGQANTPNPEGAEGLHQGLNDNRPPTYGWHGPAPPPGSGVHHYHFQVFALDQRLDIAGSADVGRLVRAMQGHVIASGELVGTYGAPAAN